MTQALQPTLEGNGVWNEPRVGSQRPDGQMATLLALATSSSAAPAYVDLSRRLDEQGAGAPTPDLVAPFSGFGGESDKQRHHPAAFAGHGDAARHRPSNAGRSPLALWHGSHVGFC